MSKRGLPENTIFVLFPYLFFRKLLFPREKELSDNI